MSHRDETKKPKLDKHGQGRGRDYTTPMERGFLPHWESPDEKKTERKEASVHVNLEGTGRKR